MLFPWWRDDGIFSEPFPLVIDWVAKVCNGHTDKFGVDDAGGRRRVTFFDTRIMVWH